MISLSFNNENQAANTKFHVFSYDETDGTKGVVFTSFIVDLQRIYVPISAIAKEGEALKGIQIAWETWGGRVYLRGIEYSPNIYAIEETISTGTYEKGNVYDVTYGVTENGVLMEGVAVTCKVADTSVLTIADGKLTVLKSGKTKITLSYTVNGTKYAVKYFNVTTTSWEDLLISELQENQLARFDRPEYLNTLSALTINKYNSQPAEKEKFQFANSSDGIKYIPAWGGSGATVTFLKPMQVSTGYLRIRVLFDRVSDRRIYNFYKYGETNGDNFVAQFKDEITAEGTAIFLYIPVENLINEQGVLEGIQFTQYSPSGWSYISEMAWVAEKP